MRKLKRLISGLLTLVLLAGILLVPGLELSPRANAAGGGYKYKYYVRAKTSWHEDAGAEEGKVYARFEFYDEKGTKNDINLDVNFTGEVNKPGKELTATSGFVTYEPWTLSRVQVRNWGTDAYRLRHIRDLRVMVYDKDERYIGTLKYNNDAKYWFGGSSDTGKWIDNGTRHEKAATPSWSFGTSSGLQTIKPTKFSEYWKDFGQEIHLSPTPSDYGSDEIIEAYYYSEPMTGSLWASLYGWDFDAWETSYARPSLSFEISGARTVISGGADASMKTLVGDNNEHSIMNIIKEDGQTRGYRINKARLVEFMDLNGINKVEIKTTMKLNPWVFSDANLNLEGTTKHGGDVFSRTMTIYRDALEIDNVQWFSGSPGSGGELIEDDGLFLRSKDNYYYNDRSEYIVAAVQLKSSATNNGYDHLDAEFFKSAANYELVENPPMIVTRNELSETGNEIYIDATHWEADKNVPGKFYFYYPINDKALQSGAAGIRLAFTSFHFKANSRLGQGDYWLTEQGVVYTDLSDTNGPWAGWVDYYQSTHKLDTVKPYITYSLAETDTVVNGWRKTANITLTASENIYCPGENADILSYYLTDKVGNAVIPITEPSGSVNKSTDGRRVGIQGGQEVSIVVSPTVEAEVDGVLTTLAADVADNQLRHAVDAARLGEIMDIKLDSRPPQVKVHTREQFNESTGDRSLEYSFTIQDASKSGRVYYSFTKTDEPPAIGQSEEAGAVTNIIESVMGKWAFLQQQYTDVNDYLSYDPTNGVAIVTAALGSGFEGWLHYYTEDALGNVMSEPVSVQVRLDNPNTDCTITVENGTDIPLKDYLINITSKTGDVYYRWVSAAYPNGVADYKPFASAAETGRGVQYDNSGKPVTLDGIWTLDVKIDVNGTARYYSRDFDFDNSVPDISFINAAAGEFKKSHTINVSAADKSGIASATVSLINADGAVESSMDSVALAPAGGILDTEVSVSGVKSGAYRLRVRAVDFNGHEFTKESNVFYIRTAPLDASVSIKDVTLENGRAVVVDNNYTLIIDAAEAFAGAVDGQYLYWRVTDDITAKGGWSVSAEPMSVTAGGYSISVSDASPVQLNEGSNYMYIQTVAGSAGAKADELLELADTDAIDIELDTTPPAYILDLTDTHTNENITGKISLRDSSGAYSVDTGTIPTSALEVTDLGGGVFSLTIKENLSGTIYAVDKLGNKAPVAIRIAGIDREPPVVTNEAPTISATGARKDASIWVTISGAEQGSERFAIIPESDLSSCRNADGSIKEYYFVGGEALTEGESEEERDSINSILTELGEAVFEQSVLTERLSEVNGERILTYELSLKGASGKYYLGVMSSDSLGNTGCVILEDALEPVDAEPAIVGEVTAGPKNANLSARAYLNFNVPVYILPESMKSGTDAENLALAEASAHGFSTAQQYVIKRTGEHELFVVDDIGRSRKITINIKSDMVSFGATDVVTARTVTLTGYYSYTDKLFVGDVEYTEIEEGRYISPDIIYFDDENDKENGLYKMARPVVEVIAPAGTYLTTSRECDEEGWVYDGNTNYHYPEGLKLWREMSEQYLVDKEDKSKGFTRLFFEVDYNDSYDEESGYYFISESTERRVDFKYRVGTEGEWITDSLMSGGIDNTGPIVNTTVTPQTVRDEDGDPTTFTAGPVVIEIDAYDPETGLKYIDMQANNLGSVDDESSWLIGSWGNGEIIDLSGITSWPHTLEYERITMVLDRTNPEKGGVFGPGDHLNIVITVTDIAEFPWFVIANTLDMEEGASNLFDRGLVIDYINPDVISAEDYTLEYFYEDYEGNWQPVGEDDYYKTAKAVLTPTAEGLARGLTVTDMTVTESGGAYEKLLTSFERVFTFNLLDKYGFTHQVSAEAHSFDELPGSISYTLSTTDKTNHPVELLITAVDNESGVGSVRVSAAEGGDIPVIKYGESYRAVITDNGNYLITMSDKVGNVATKSFAVANIDDVLPRVVNISYNVAEGEVTAGNVVAQLEYNKRGVTISRVEIATGLKETDYAVNFEASRIRFFENGSLAVYFKDEYGNEGFEIVSADQIYRNPPAVEAVATLSADTKRVDISFKKAMNGDVPVDIHRELSDLNIKYGGMVQRAETIIEDDKGFKTSQLAVFSFNRNGSYTFVVYDDDGISANVTVDITEIDSGAPTITQISWSYDYEVLEGGQWVKKTQTGSHTPGTEEGYLIYPQDPNATEADPNASPVTNQDVSVTITTDEETTIKGDSESVLGRSHTLDYTDNGMYTFNAQKPNGVYDSYSVQVDVIDKIPPVLTLAMPELVFYENEAANEKPYTKDMLTKAGEVFEAYDLFKGRKELNERVEIDFGTFNPDDISANTFDRSKPYTITYRVSDDAHNVTEAQLTVRLVGESDAVVLVNDRFPDYAGRVQLIGTEEIRLKIGNFGGKAYASVFEGTHTLGEMKSGGELLSETAPGSCEYKFAAEAGNWYTFLIQTDKRDYFLIQVYVTE